MDLLLTARQVSADEALRIGLIGRVVPDGTALDEALAIAEVIDANGPLAVEAIKRSVQRDRGHVRGRRPGPGARDRVADLRHRGRQEGPRAFAEKRPPDFRRK